MRAMTEMLGGNAAKANMAGLTHVHPAYGRPGYADPHERLADMDVDGVDIEVLYCEVSAYRYLYLMERGSHEATRAFNDTLLDFASVDPRRLVVTAQVPIHDIDFAVDEVQRVAAAGCKSLQLPVFPAEVGQPDYHDERYDRALLGHRRDRPAGLLPHRAQHRPQPAGRPRPHAPPGVDA